jgi:mycothiol synthase
MDELTMERLYLPEAPIVDGLFFRRFRDEIDYAAMAEVMNAYNAAEQIEEVETVGHFANWLSHLPGFDPRQDILLAEYNGRLIGVNWVWRRQEVGGDTIYDHFGVLLPEWRRRGLGRAMLHQAEERLRQIATQHSDAGPCWLQSFGGETEVAAEALLTSEGYAPVRYNYLMVRPTLDDIPDLPLPDRVEVRPVKPEHMRAIWEANVEAFRDHWGAGQRTERDYERWLNDPDADPGLWRVAWTGDQVVGMVLSFILEEENARYQRRRGYTESICVRRPWRKRGIASALIARSLQAVKERGMTEAALGVDTQNLSGALRVYERLGYRPVQRFTTYRKPL